MELNKNFVAYYQAIVTEYLSKGSKSNYGSWKASFIYVQKFFGPKINSKSLTIDLIKKYRHFLLTTNRIKSKTATLSINTAATYYKQFIYVLKRAYKDHIISENLALHTDYIKEEVTFREYLTEEELKEKEFKDLYKDSGEEKNYVKDLTIDTDFELLFPDDYVNNITERLNLYNKLGELKTEEELHKFELEIIDRFGEFPHQVEDLLDSVRIKWIAKKLGVEKLILKNKRMLCYFISDQQSTFYQTEMFTKVLQYVQRNGQSCVMKEKETKNGLRLLLTFIKITSVKKALETLQKI